MRWEYMTLALQVGHFFGVNFDAEKLNRRLNALGHEGWEVVSTFDTNAGHGQSQQVVVILKRPVPGG